MKLHPVHAIGVALCGLTRATGPLLVNVDLTQCNNLTSEAFAACGAIKGLQQLVAASCSGFSPETLVAVGKRGNLVEVV